MSTVLTWDNITSELTSSSWFNKNVTSSMFRLNIAWTNGDWKRDVEKNMTHHILNLHQHWIHSIVYYLLSDWMNSAG